jgi:hypothetical protein
MRIAVIPAGRYVPQGKGRNITYELEAFEDVKHFAKAEVAFLKIPVMSVKNYSKYVKQLSADLRRPPHGVITNIYLEPDAKSQFAVKFEVIDSVSSDLLPTVMQRHTAERASIDFPYSPPLDDDDRAVAPVRSNNKLRGKAGAKPK